MLFGLYYTILYYTILYCTVLYFTILYYTILYYTILSRRWRRQVSLVAQEPVLFGCSIRDNIAYGVDGATDDEVTAL